MNCIIISVPLLQDLEQEFQDRQAKKTDQPRSLWQELSDIGEEFVEFLEQGVSPANKAEAKAKAASQQRWVLPISCILMIYHITWMCLQQVLYLVATSRQYLHKSVLQNSCKNILSDTQIHSVNLRRHLLWYLCNTAVPKLLHGECLVCLHSNVSLKTRLKHWNTSKGKLSIVSSTVVSASQIRYDLKTWGR